MKRPKAALSDAALVGREAWDGKNSRYGLFRRVSRPGGLLLSVLVPKLRDWHRFVYFHE